MADGDDLLRPIDEARRSLYGRLRALPPETLTKRPASVHAAIRFDAIEREQAVRAAERNLLHLRAHVRYIERTLGEPGR